MKRSKAAWSAMVRYIALAMVTTATQWVEKFGSTDFTAITWSSWCMLGLGLASAGLVAANAVMNKSWHNGELDKNGKVVNDI